MSLGIIAEDNSDVEVMSAITLRILKPQRIGFKRFVGDGCGKLRRKCAVWAVDLVQRGCRWIAVVHDLDTESEEDLSATLSAAVGSASAEATVILIPRREIEAWLLYDAAAIAAAFGETRHPRLPGDPEGLRDPKKHLEQLIWTTYRKRYLHTVHNAKIAQDLNVDHLDRARSFAPYPPFSVVIRDALRTGRARSKQGSAKVRTRRRR